MYRKRKGNEKKGRWNNQGNKIKCEGVTRLIGVGGRGLGVAGSGEKVQ
jgi:hypothetical protein